MRSLGRARDMEEGLVGESFARCFPFRWLGSPLRRGIANGCFSMPGKQKETNHFGRVPAVWGDSHGAVQVYLGRRVVTRNIPEAKHTSSVHLANSPGLRYQTKQSLERSVPRERREPIESSSQLANSKSPAPGNREPFREPQVGRGKQEPRKRVVDSGGYLKLM